MNVYLASRYSRREELLRHKTSLEELGYRVTSRWLQGDHQISDDEMSDDARRQAKAHFATEDWEDLLAADIVISFSEEPRSSNSRGGRHVEFGAALALGKTSIVVGPVENVFHLLEGVHRFDSFEEALSSELLPAHPSLWSHDVCSSCGQMKPDVKWVVDPFLEEIYDLIEMKWLCDSCYQEFCDDV